MTIAAERNRLHARSGVGAARSLPTQWVRTGAHRTGRTADTILEHRHMTSAEGIRPSIWDLTAPVPDMPPAALQDEVVMCVIGAGISGLTTAYELLRAGHDVIVLDDGPIGGGETGRTTAQLATSFDDDYHEVEKLLGENSSRLLGEAFRAGVDAIERIVRDERIDCDFVRLDGWWVPSTDDAPERLRNECAAARRAGLPEVELVSNHPLTSLYPGVALRFPQQAQFHVLRYLTGLADAIHRLGGRIVTNAHVETVDDAKDDADQCVVHLADGRQLRAAHVVVATNTPIIDWVAMHTKQAAYRSYVIGARVPRGSVPVSQFWDTDRPYHYVRLLKGPLADGDTDVLIVGGEDHKTGQSDDESSAFDRLEEWTRARFPVQAIEARWSGQVMEPVDYVAYIGKNPGSRRLWIVTGDSGNGMTHGTIAGLLLPTLIAGEPHRWEELFSPSRITVAATTALSFAKDALDVAAQYAAFVTEGDVSDVSEIPLGEGRIIRKGLKKLAVFRAESGSLTVRTAVCPHLGCIVDWNDAEKTWDCPCHGSRFATDGSVLNGPTTMPLSEEALEA